MDNESNNRSISQELLSNYQKLHLADGSEAATRLKVIDRVLRQILCWSEDDIEPEERVSEDGATTYADYVLRTANTAIVIEAKKAGAAFTALSGRRREKLSKQFLETELGKAAIQARDYRWPRNSQTNSQLRRPQHGTNCKKSTTPSDALAQSIAKGAGAIRKASSKVG